MASASQLLIRPANPVRLNSHETKVGADVGHYGLAAHPVAVSTFTPAQVHCFEGVAVYFVGLVLVYELVLRFDRGEAPVKSGR